MVNVPISATFHFQGQIAVKCFLIDKVATIKNHIHQVIIILRQRVRFTQKAQAMLYHHTSETALNMSLWEFGDFSRGLPIFSYFLFCERDFFVLFDLMLQCVKFSGTN